MTEFKAGDKICLGENATQRAQNDLWTKKVYTVDEVTKQGKLSLKGTCGAPYLARSFVKLEQWEACELMGINPEGIRPGDTIKATRTHTYYEVFRDKEYECVGFTCEEGGDCMLVKGLEKHGFFPTEWFKRFEPNEAMIDLDAQTINEEDERMAQNAILPAEQTRGESEVIGDAISATMNNMFNR